MAGGGSLAMDRCQGWRGRAATFLAYAALALGLGAARAEPPTQLALSESPAERCLFPPSAERAKPVYPQDMLRDKRGASFDAQFSFTGPEAAPQVRFSGDIDPDFRDSITAYAKQLRVPCMDKSGTPVTLTQGFDFVPNDGRKVAWTTPVDSKDAERRAQFKCVVSNDALRPEYPRDMLRNGRSGMVVARLRFVAPDQPPQVDILDNAGGQSFARNVLRYTEGMRMPCLQGAAVETTLHYRFLIDGEQRVVLNDIDLRSFLKAIKPVPAGTAYFDTRTMKCPFDVRMTWLRPYEPNVIAELEEDVASRHALLDWMAQREFDVDPKNTNALLGQQMVVHIPCATIDL